MYNSYLCYISSDLHSSLQGRSVCAGGQGSLTWNNWRIVTDMCAPELFIMQQYLQYRKYMLCKIEIHAKIVTDMCAPAPHTELLFIDIRQLGLGNMLAACTELHCTVLS